MHKTIEMALGAAVATAGTFTVSYPDGTSKADFLKGVDHRMVVLQKELFAPSDFTIAFGDSAATITYNGTTTLPISSDVIVQLDMASSGSVLNTDFANLERTLQHKIARVQLGNPDAGDLDLLIDAATGTELPDSTPTSITYTAATRGTSPQDNGSIPATSDAPGEVCYDLTFARNIQAKQTAASGNTVASTVTINGYDEYLNAMTETITLPLSSTSVTVQGLKAFRYVRSFVIYSASDISGETLEVGTGNVLGLPVFITSQSEILAEYENNTRLAQNNKLIDLPFLIDSTKYAAGTSVYTPACPVAGAIKKAVTTTQVQTDGAGAVTLELATVAVNGVSVIVPSVSTVGSVVSSSATADHATTAIAAGVPVEIVGDGTPTAGEVVGYVQVEPTSHMRGVLVAGSRANPTATTGDVRGTYTPEATPDGSLAFSLDVLVDNPSYIGGENYAA